MSTNALPKREHEHTRHHNQPVPISPQHTQRPTMSTDIPRETHQGSTPILRKQARVARRRKQALLVIGVVTALAVAVTLMSGGISPGQSDSALTHTIARGDLMVTVEEVIGGTKLERKFDMVVLATGMEPAGVDFKLDEGRSRRNNRSGVLPPVHPN